MRTFRTVQDLRDPSEHLEDDDVGDRELCVSVEEQSELADEGRVRRFGSEGRVVERDGPDVGEERWAGVCSRQLFGAVRPGVRTTKAVCVLREMSS